MKDFLIRVHLFFMVIYAVLFFSVCKLFGIDLEDDF